jgi:hypothetical protein
MNRLRVTLGLALILVFAARGFVLITWELRLAARGIGPETDMVTRAEARFRLVADRLPPRGVVGYRASGPLSIDRDYEIEGDDRSIGQFVLAQYALAPRVLDLNPGPPIVVHDGLDGIRVMAEQAR